MNMTFAEYQALPAINASAIKAGFALSMKHMHAIMTGKPKEQTPAMKWGKMVHSAILERELFFDTMNVFDGTKRGKDWEAFKDGKDIDTIVTRDELSELAAISEAVHLNPDAHRLIRRSTHEQTAIWSDPDYGSAKARLDGFSVEDGMIELKTTSKIKPDMFAKQFCGMGYDIQCGWYCEGARLSGLSKKLPACFVIVIESSEPFDVAVYELPNTVIKVGLSKAKRIATAYRQAEKSGVFAGVSEGITELVMPSWYGENDVMEAFAEASAAALFGESE
jgi:hypothetical protein